jgi:hypothetical protein
VLVHTSIHDCTHGVVGDGVADFGVKVCSGSDLAMGIAVKPVKEMLRNFDALVYKNYVTAPTRLPSMHDEVGVFS